MSAFVDVLLHVSDSIPHCALLAVAKFDECRTDPQTTPLTQSALWDGQD